MKILITGADGYLGSRAVRYYSREHTVLAPTHAQMDICDDESVRTYVLRNRPDAILHCAAISDVGRCDEEPVLSQKINVEGSVNMAQAAKVVGAKCLLCSSDQVYTGSGGTRPHAETESLCPKNTYGRQKREAEVRCHAVNPDCVLLRLSWLYDTQTIHPREHGDLIKMLLNGTLMAFSAQDRRGVTDVNEVIRNTEKALRLSGGIYNFGALSREGMLATMREALHGFLRVEATEDEIPCNLSMDTSLCRANGIVFRDTAAALRKNFARAATRVRPMRMEEAELLKTFLLHAIFVPDGEAEPDASILAKEEL